jgi:parallel beta-helix repeat protein
VIESTTIRTDAGAMRRSRLLSLAATALLLPAAASAETFTCTEIASLPATISTSGHYCLHRNFVQDFTSHIAIDIEADDVVLDCNDHTVRDTAAASNGSGVYAYADRRRVVIRHCNFDGFYYGINFVSLTSGARDNIVQDNSVVRARAAGIYVWGSGNLIENNRVTELRGDLAGTNPTGIFVAGPSNIGSGNVIRGNLIANFKPTPPSGTPYSIGINLSGLQDTVVSDNTVTGVYAHTGGGTYGIVASGSTGVSVTGNFLASPPLPYSAPFDGGNYYGVYLIGTTLEQASNLCADNQVGHFNTDILGCNKVGNNEF